MNRLTDHDHNFGPFTIARWNGRFAAYIHSGDDENPGCALLLNAFGWALLKWLWPAKIRRSLDIQFSAEVGPEKGSWKGGTIGHGIEMQRGETAFSAFVRYCEMEHDARRGKKYKIKFVGFAQAPLPKSVNPESAKDAEAKE